jgi:TetR/AcrR family transcriptional regulator, cholesterol catabolism regulator
MDEKYDQLMEKTRELSFQYPVRRMSFEKIAAILGVSKAELKTYVKTKTELVEKALEFERNTFKFIFSKHDFEGVNAIDILFTVSKEMSSRFRDINPTLTVDLRKYYPEIYQKHIEDKYDFIYNKMKINIEKGIQQEMYRNDLSVELVARLYMARLMDIHNPELFPLKMFSFDLLFNYTIENFVRSIATPEGLDYFEKKKKCLRLENTEK